MSNTRNNKPQQENMANGTLPQALPPLPIIGDNGPEACATIRLYLAVWDDLTPPQKEVVARHVQSCELCQKEQQVLSRTTKLMRHLPASEPGAQVDQAVLVAIARRRMNRPRPVSLADLAAGRSGTRNKQRRSPARLIGVLAAAVLILTIAFSASSLLGLHTQAFVVPTNVTWDNYVLYSKQTVTNARGEHYEVMSYHNMSVNVMNVETVMSGKLDVMVVADQQKALGLDMMHHVAQWDAQEWMHDPPLFNLTQLRQDLSSGKATYLGKGTFQGKDVYRIRASDGHVLLLDMHYMLVNVLPQASGQQKPMYDTVQWLQPSQVSTSLWDMQVPGNFRMGQLPGQP
ncbi:hypothetical protein KDH_55180 [Dictyobacter sp. S3.2.2.5]|uniref:Zinc-finger domain-containing protein n=1 Tax=Dictyobacter halimunensis TaxID=3026934 RepID=A0ABQ6FWP6_9CHLR|nr:hypothetical protein KDH_55180 [Dictyobacter sp. S3.2.2.5]